MVYIFKIGVVDDRCCLLLLWQQWGWTSHGRSDGRPR